MVELAWDSVWVTNLEINRIPPFCFVEPEPFLLKKYRVKNFA